MSDFKLTVHKEVQSDPSDTTWAVTMKVVEAVGVSPSVFVIQYTPYSKYTGPATHVYNNVAYLDEFVSIPNKVTNSSKSCKYRSSEFTHRFSTKEACYIFISEVECYLKRLLYQLECGLNLGYYSDVVITPDSIKQDSCVDHRPPIEDSPDDKIYTDDPADDSEEDSDITVLSLNANGD